MSDEREPRVGTPERKTWQAEKNAKAAKALSYFKGTCGTGRKLFQAFSKG